HSPARTYSLLQCGNLASVLVMYALLVNFLETREQASAFVRRTLWGAIVGSSIGIAAFVLASAGLDVGGAEVSRLAAERLTQAYGAYGVMLEPNIFGSFTGAALVLAITLVAGLPRDGSATREIRLAWWAAGTAAVGLVLSFTRAAWLGALVGLVCCLVAIGRLSTRHWRWRALGVPLAVAAAVALALLVAPGEA